MILFEIIKDEFPKVRHHLSFIQLVERISSTASLDSSLYVMKLGRCIPTDSLVLCVRERGRERERDMVMGSVQCDIAVWPVQSRLTVSERQRQRLTLDVSTSPSLMSLTTLLLSLSSH